MFWRIRTCRQTLPDSFPWQDAAPALGYRIGVEALGKGVGLAFPMVKRCDLIVNTLIVTLRVGRGVLLAVLGADR